jgi:hypothetical protein
MPIPLAVRRGQRPRWPGAALPCAKKADKIEVESARYGFATEKWPGGWPMCRYCVSGSSHSQTERTQILDLLALIERPNVLPAETALRIASKLLKWADRMEPRFRCEALTVHKTQLNAVT